MVWYGVVCLSVPGSAGRCPNMCEGNSSAGGQNRPGVSQARAGPARQLGGRRSGHHHQSPGGRFDLQLDFTGWLSKTVPDCHSLSEGFSKVHNTPVINTGGTLLTQRRLEMQDFILGIIYLNKDMISKQV